MSPRATAASSVGEAPASACSWNSKPEELPRPMMGGRLKAKTLAAAICWKAALTVFNASNTERLPALRSSNGFRATTTRARLGRASPSSRLKPLTVKMLCSQGCPSIDFSTCSTAPSVRLVEAASGSWTSAMKAPWSSSGRKPEETMEPIPPVPATKPATSNRATMPRRASGVTTFTYPSRVRSMRPCIQPMTPVGFFL